MTTTTSPRHDAAGIRLAGDLDSLSRDEIVATQQRNLGATLAAARRSAAVLKRYPGLESVDGVDDLAELPLLSATDLAAGCPPHSTELLLDPQSPGLALRSSGTASRPKVVYHSWAFNDRVMRLGERGIRAALESTPSRVANCMLAGEFGGAFLFVQDVARRLPALAFPLGSRTSPAEAAGIIEAHGIDTLVATPAYGTELLADAGAGGGLPLRHFLFIGEAMGAERERTVRRVAPGVRVRSLAYSTSETGPLGYQCPHQQGTVHHLHEDANVVEVVDGTGRPVPPGTAGELVVTPLTTTGTALFRYRLGDRGRLVTGPCDCGSAARAVMLLGRMPQSMTVDGTTFSSDQLMGRLEHLGVRRPADCQLQVLWEGHRYRVRLLLSPDTPAGISADSVRTTLRDAHQIRRMITSSRCREFEVLRTPTDRFARTRHGKVPVLYQHPIPD